MLVLVLSVLLLPVPLVAGEGEVAPASAPVPLTLYAQASGGPSTTLSRLLSSIPGDAMPSESATQAVGGFRSATGVLERPLRLATDLNVSLAVAQPAGSQVNATIALYATDLFGRNVSIAQREFRPPAPSPTADTAGFVAATPLDLTPADERAILMAAEDALSRDVEGNVAWMALNTTYGLPSICGSPLTFQCQQLTGHYGTGQVRWCKGPSGGGVWRTVHDGVDTVDATYRAARPALPTPASAVAPCAGAFDVANATAEAAPSAPGAPGLPPPPATSYTPPDWRSIALDASESALASGDVVEIPAGYRLVLAVSAVAGPHGSASRAPVVFEVGRSDASSRLHAWTWTAGTFDDLAYGRELIGPGPHTGTYANAADVRHYAFDTLADEVVMARAGAATVLRLRDADGRVVDSLTTTGAPGRWTLTVQRTSATVGAYAFTLEHPVPETPVRQAFDGSNAGELDASTDREPWTFHASRGQWVEATLRAPTSGAGAASLVFAPFSFRSGTYSETTLPDGSLSYRGRAADTRMIAFDVVRAWGDFTYELDLWRDPEGDHAQRPAFQTLLLGDQKLSLHGGFLGAVDVSVGDAGAVLRVSPEGVEPLGGALETVSFEDERAAAHTAEGALVAGRTVDAGIERVRAASMLREGEIVPLRTLARSFAFGPDGRLWALDGNASLVGLGADRSEVVIPVQRMAPFGSGTVFFSPDGLARVRINDSHYVVDVTAQTVASDATPVPKLVDLAGNGYRMVSWNERFVERVAPDGRTSTAAWTADGTVRQIAVSGTRLYAVIAPLVAAGEDAPWRLAYVDLGTPMFEGFQPTFIPSPTAELRATGLTLRSQGIEVVGTSVVERFDVDVALVNEGEGDSFPFLVEAQNLCYPGTLSCGVVHAMAPAMQAGGSATVRLSWTTHPRVGDQAFAVHVDRLQAVTEANESDSRVRFEVPLLLPTHDTCRSLPARPGDICDRLSL